MIEDRELKRYFIPVSCEVAALGPSADHAAREISKHVREHGSFVVPDGQILRQEIHPSQVGDFFSYDEAEAELTPRREWTSEHAAYFGYENPFQVGDGAETYGIASVMVDIPEPFLGAEEEILAIVHAERDGRYYYCSCHEAQVVYTSERRVVCMFCGALHCVLRDPIPILDAMELTSAQWFALFSEDSAFLDEEVRIRTVDFQDIEQADRLWETDRYVEAARDVTFFARATPEEFERYRGSVITPGVLVEAGFEHEPTPPPPVAQVGHAIELDLLENAATSLRSGASAFVRSRADIGEIKQAVLALFHALELILKARLSDLTPSALGTQPNNPQVITQLQVGGVALTDDEVEIITSLRRLRNAVQHGEAEIEYRSTRRLLRSTIDFLDRFTVDELGLWIGDVIDSSDWWTLLRIPTVRARAHKHARGVLADLDPTKRHLSTCPRCGEDTLVATSMHGSYCSYCRHRPRIEELMPGSFRISDSAETRRAVSS